MILEVRIVKELRARFLQVLIPKDFVFWLLPVVRFLGAPPPGHL
jgi:hypothetical protein